VFGSPVIFDGVLMLGVSGGSAELGNEADRYAFQGSMNFLDASSGRVLKKTWSIHPPKQPDDQFAGAGIWSTPAIDTEEKLAYVGAGNPFKPQAEHPHADAILKLDVNRASPSFGEIIGSYKGVIDEYVPAFSQLPCFDIPGNPPPYYPQGIGQCGDIDLDFGAAPNLFRDKSGRKLVGEGQKSGVYHVVDAATMKPVWTQVVGPPTSVGGIVGSTAVEDGNVFGPITVPGYVWSLSTATGSPRWVGPIGDGAHWGPPVTTANGVVYSVDASGFLNAFDARQGVLLAKRPLQLGGGGPLALSWGGVSVARNTVYAAVGVVGLADGFVAAFRRGGPAQIVDDLQQTNLGGGGGGGGGPAGPSILAGPAAANTGYATPVASTRKGGPLSFVNLDVVLHDVTSDQKGPDGTPLFRSKLIGLGESAPIEGLDKVEPGKQYGFFCSVHPGMRGTLAVQ
jgi:polyvinyl alcohol dehydrogenase (cytochrome)